MHHTETKYKQTKLHFSYPGLKNMPINLHPEVHENPCACVFCHHTPCPGLRTGSLLVLCLCLDLQILHDIHTEVNNIHSSVGRTESILMCICSPLPPLALRPRSEPLSTGVTSTPFSSGRAVRVQTRMHTKMRKEATLVTVCCNQT